MKLLECILSTAVPMTGESDAFPSFRLLADDESVSSCTAESSFCTAPGDDPRWVVGLAEEVRGCLDAPGAVQRIAADECACGTYLVEEGGRPLAVAKPRDEEPGMVHNKRYSESQKTGFAPGEGYKREQFAALIGQYAGVPETTAMLMPERVFGRNGGGSVYASVQRFVPNDGESWDCGPAKFCAADVRRIGLLDLQILNCDRHGGNILIHRVEDEDGEETIRLTPIDHGFTLPTSLADLDFEWLTWRQAKTPFSHADLDYINGIDVDAQAALLHDLGVEPAAVELFQAATMAVVSGAAAGLTLADLGAFFRREVLDVPSQLEVLVAKATRRGAIDFAAYSCLLATACAAAARARA